MWLSPATHQPNFEIMKYYDGLIELSDRRILWEVKSDYTEDDLAYIADWACFDFKIIYGVEVYCEGRSARHICVDDTPQNRRAYANMKRTVRRLQNKIIAYLNNVGNTEVA